MRILVAGASGAIGRQLVPRLVERGHEVTGMMRSESKRDMVAALGARPVVADALDPDAVGAVVSAAEPEVVVHQLTAIGEFGRNVAASFAQTNRLRTEGTDNLLSAARAAGVRRFVAQSFANLPLGEPPEQFRSTVGAVRHLESAVLSADRIEGIVLRYGGFYGPGTSIATEPGAAHAEAIRRRQFPVVGDGGAVWFFVHIADAAEATVAAIERGDPGLYTVADDEPAPVREWLPALADALDAPRPRHVPRWVGRVLAGKALVTLMTEMHGASTEKGARDLGWEPRYPSWRQGFALGLGS